MKTKKFNNAFKIGLMLAMFTFVSHDISYGNYVLVEPDYVDATSLLNNPIRTPDKLCDRIIVMNSNTNVWESVYTNGQENHCWMEYSWDSPVTLTRSVMYATYSGTIHFNKIRNYIIKFKKLDASGYIALPEFVDPNDEGGVYSQSFEAIETTAIRIDLLCAEDQEWFGGCGDVATITEWEVYGVPEPPCGWIAFYSNQDGDADIWAVRTDGTGLRQLTNQPGGQYEPQWSPDSAKIAYSSEVEAQIWVFDWLTGQNTKVYDAHNYEGSDLGSYWVTGPAWSPDGSKILFREDASYNNPHITLINADGTGRAIVPVQGGYVKGPSWSPSGKAFVYARRNSGAPYTDDLWIYDFSGTGDIMNGINHRLTEGGASESTTKLEPDWMPSGDIVSTWGHNLVKIDPGQPGNWNGPISVLSDSAVTVLTDDAAWPSRSYEVPSWSPDLDHIVYKLALSGQPAQLWIMDRAGGNRQLLTEGHGPDWGNPPPPEPVAYYPFDSDASDASGNGHDGTVFGATLCDDRCYLPESAYCFDGVDDYIDMGTPNDLRITGALTASAWFLAEPEQGSHPTLVSRYGRDLHYNRCWRLSLSNEGKPETCVSETGWAEVKLTGSNVVSTNIWHHVAMTYEPSTSLRVYLDGILAAETTSSIPGSINNPEDVSVYVGAFWWYGEGPGALFKGTIDEVRIYDRALSACEIEELAGECEPPCGASFQGLGDLPGGAFASYALGVSSDGSVVVGYSTSSFGEREAFRWTASEGMQPLGDFPGGSFYSVAYEASGDGSVVVGNGISASGEEVFRWTAETGMVGLGQLPGHPHSGAGGTSADGSQVVGWCGTTGVGWGTQAFLWTLTDPETGEGMMEALEDPPHDGVISNGLHISPDGSTIVGCHGVSPRIEACRWIDGTVYSLASGVASVAASCSADGSVIIGYRVPFMGSGDTEAFRWTSAGGMVGLGYISSDGSQSGARDITADGSVVVGQCTSASGSEAFVWDPVNGMRSLQDVLEDDYGLDLTGWKLEDAYEISADGLTIVGYGTNPSGNTEAWIVRLCEENTEPVANAGEDQTVDTGPDGTGEVVLDCSDSNDPDGDQLTYTWFIDGNEVASGVNPTIVLPCGNYTVELIVNDGIGDSEPDYVEINVEDGTPPAITCPNNVTLECPADTSVAANGSATATDNCDEAPTITYSDLSYGTCPKIIERRWTATDESSNSASCVQVITVQDTTAPVITNPPEDMTVQRDGNGNTEQLNTWLAQVVEAMDTCGGVSVNNDYTSFPYQCGNTGSLTVTWTATDECGNEATSAATFTIEDPTAGVTYDGDLLLSTAGNPTVNANLVATLKDEQGNQLDIDNEKVTFTLTADGIAVPIVVTADTSGGVATVVQALEPAIYMITVTLECSDYTASSILVVYNPEGGFATGGGWIVPENDGLNTYPNERANFGFNAKYKQGDPTGHLEFRYSDGYIDLKSSSIEQLVITGGKIVQFKGSAVVNREAGHKFFVKAIDNDKSGNSDTLDIKIWAPGVNPEGDPTERAGGVLQGGNIVVHTK